MTDLADATEAQLARALAAKRKARRAPAKRARAVSVNDPASKLNGEPGEATLRKRLTPAQRQFVLARDGFWCKCGSPIGWSTNDTSDALPIMIAEFDHIVPLELGGGAGVDNIQALCPRCHRAKTKLDVAQIAKAKRQAKLLKPREPSKRPLRSRGFARRGTGE
jgi:HNH endonuclease